MSANPIVLQFRSWLWMATFLLLGVIAGYALVGLYGRAGADTAAQVEHFASALPRVSSDYNPAVGPDELAAVAQVVVLGRIGGFEEGRTFVDSRGQTLQETAVMVINVESVVYGELPDPRHPRLYFEVRLNNLVSIAAMNAAIPRGARVLVYASEEGEFSHPVVGEGRGLPASQQRMSVVGPQGFLLQAGDLVYVGFFATGATEVARGLSLEDFAPPAAWWPVPLEP